MNTKIQKSIMGLFFTLGMVLLFALFSWEFSTPSFASFYSVKAYDSIAGYGTEIKIGNATPSEQVKIYVLPPVGDLQTYLQTTGKDGTLSFILSPAKTQKAGIYKVVVVEKSQSYSDGVVHSFEIFPDDPAPSHSFFYSIDNTIPTGTKGKLTVLLRDKYDNPIAGHRIALKSSRASEKFTSIGNNTTNDAGEASFIVQSAYTGDALISATDETYGEKIGTSLTLRWYANGISSNLLGDSFGNTSSVPVARFSLDFPDTVPVNSDANYLTITALDASGNIVKNFTGSVRITVPTDANATVPATSGVYTFTEADQGRITFSRSLMFSTAGKQRIEVYAYNKASDETNVNIFGKKEVTVENKTVGVEDPNTTPINITSPSNNTVLAAKSVIITGTALKNTDLHVMIDGKIVKNIETDDSGDFSTTLLDLELGDHTLQIQQKNNTKVISESVHFRVGEGVGSILSATILPKVVKPKDMVEIQVTIDTTISPKSLDVSINGISYPLAQIKTGIYQTSFPAPSVEGEYSVKVALQNSLGEIQEKTLEQQLTVQNSTTTPSGSAQVTGVTAEYIPERKVVQLSWNALSPPPLLYIVQSGTSESTLQKIKSVSGTKNSTEIEMASFQEKYFSVIAVDIDGKEGPLSEKVLLKPPVTIAPTPTPTPTSTSTPMPTFTPTATPLPIITAISQENALRISWTPYAGAVKYRLSYGQQSRIYQEEIVMKADILNTTLSDLIPGISYYITIDTLDNNGTVLYSYPEIIRSPINSAFHASATKPPQPYPQWMNETGPQFSLFMGGFFLLIAGWILNRRKRIFSK